MANHHRHKIVLALLVVAGAWLIVPARLQAQQPAAPCRTGLVLVADGAGDSVEASSNLFRIVREQGLPLEVYRWPWSHGRFRAIADQTDEANLRSHGRRMAEYLWAYHQQN